MPPPATETWSVSATKRWLHGLWEYYRSYTQTAVHAVSAAALTALGLLIFVNRFFVVLAIAAYICPPVILYSIDSDVGRPSDSSTAPPVQADSGTHSDTDSDSDDRDTDTDGSDADADADGADADADADG